MEKKQRFSNLETKGDENQLSSIGTWFLKTTAETRNLGIEMWISMA